MLTLVHPRRGGQGGDPPKRRSNVTRTVSGEEAQRLRSRAGTTACLAEMLGITENHLQSVISGKRASYGVAVRAARIAGVPVEQLLGELAPVQRCPHCGGTWEAP